MKLDPRYAYMTAYLKGEEAKSAGGNHIDRMTRATNLSDAIGILSGTDVGSFLQGTGANSFEDIDRALWEYFAGRIACVEQFRCIPADMLSISSSFLIKYDIANVKAVLDAMATGEAPSLIPLGVLHNESLLEDMCASETMEDVANVLTRARLPALIEAVMVYDPEKGPAQKMKVESSLESEYYRAMMTTARKIRDGEVLLKAYGLIIDLANLSIVCRAIVAGFGSSAGDSLIIGGYLIDEKALRGMLPHNLSDAVRRMGIPQYRDVLGEIAVRYEHSRSAAVIEELIERHKHATLRELLSPHALSPLVMAWYLVFKEIEIRNVRILLNAVCEGADMEEIRRYLL